MGLHLLYRPANLGEFVGNETTIKMVSKKIKNGFPHSTLITGPSGCGKTTLARNIATEMGVYDVRKPEDNYNFIELNASDFRGIDTVRKVRQKVQLAPMGGKDKVFYLFDEVHQLTGDAQEAMLKLLEDTPSHVFFILCTTNPEKLRTTFKRRCTHFEVSPLSFDEITEHLQLVCDSERAQVPNSVIEHLARISEGSPGIALVTLDKIIGLPKKEMKAQASAIVLKQNRVVDLCKAFLQRKKWVKISKYLKRMDEEPETIRRAVLGYMGAVMINSPAQAELCYIVMSAFESPFYDTGRPGLYMACFQAVSDYLE